MVNVSREWKEYCKLFSLNPYSMKVRNDSYHLQGFQQWQALKQQFNYYRYMSQNV